VVLLDLLTYLDTIVSLTVVEAFRHMCIVMI